jgi:hypothetical protein
MLESPRHSLGARPLMELAELLIAHAIGAQTQSSDWAAFLRQVPRDELELLARLQPRGSARQALDAGDRARFAK